MNTVRDLANTKRLSGRPAYPVGRPFPRFPLLTEMTFGPHALSAYATDGGVRDALGARMAELAVLSQRYTILVVSQINNRNARAPQPLGAMKGASAIEQSLWAAVAYGDTGDGKSRALVLAKL